MPASGIAPELSAHHMAPAGAIAHSRPHLCPRALTLSLSSLVSPLRPLGMGFWVVATLGLLCVSTTLRTQVQPAIEFVSGKEGLRPLFWLFSFLLYGVTGIRAPQVRLLAHPEFRGLSGGRGEMAMAVASSARLAFLRGAVCACCTLRQLLSLFGPCTAVVR